MFFFFRRAAVVIMPVLRFFNLKAKKAMEKKYQLTDQVIIIEGRTLHRIKALRDFSDVKAGDLGGWIEKEENLSHTGKAWVVGGDLVCGKVEIPGNAYVYDNANVSGNARVYGNAKVFGNATVRGNARVYGNAMVNEHVDVCDHAKIYGCARLYGSAKICYHATVYGNAWVFGEACVSDYAEIFDDAEVFGDAKIFDNACVYGVANVCDHATIGGDAKVGDHADYITFRDLWSSGRYFTWTRSNNMWRVGCFYGTGEELIKKGYADSERSGREYERVVRYVESILADEKEENEHQ